MSKTLFLCLKTILNKFYKNLRKLISQNSPGQNFVTKVSYELFFYWTLL